MANQIEITISGVGGQGSVTCGNLIAKGAAIHDHKKATLSSEYGVETRGTFAKSDVIISDDEIYFPDVTEPNLIICLHEKAYERYSGHMDPKAIMIYNSDVIQANEAYADQEKGIPITQLAKELGNPAVINILTMGIIVGYTNCISVEAAKQSIRLFFEGKEKLIDLNFRAFDLGVEEGKKQIQ